jgi:hypothetical protein
MNNLLPRSPWSKVAKRLQPGESKPLPKDKRPEGFADSYALSIGQLSAAPSMATFNVPRPVDVIRDGLGIVLVRPSPSDPRLIEVVDTLTIDGPAFQRAVIRLAQDHRQFARLTRRR